MISIFVKDMRFPLLLDAYGVLLTERKRELLEYYYDDDLSLSEIAELTGLTRQGARDGIRKAEEELRAFEDKLSLVRGAAVVADVTETLFALAGKAEDPAFADAIREAASRLAALRPAGNTKE